MTNDQGQLTPIPYLTPPPPQSPIPYILGLSSFIVGGVSFTLHSLLQIFAFLGPMAPPDSPRPKDLGRLNMAAFYLSWIVTTWLVYTGVRAFLGKAANRRSVRRSFVIFIIA